MSNENQEKTLSAQEIVTPTPSTAKKSKSRSWTQQSYGDKISSAHVVITATREYLPQLTRRGIDESLVVRLEELVRTATDSNNRQELLKGELRKMTAALDAVIVEMGTKLSEIKKIVKIEIPRPEWKKFGFDDIK
jgi:hypothetical protein